MRRRPIVATPTDYRWALVFSRLSPDGTPPTETHHKQGRTGRLYGDPANLIGLSHADHERQHRTPDPTPQTG